MQKSQINSNFEVIGFDADDTLWETETLFYEAQNKFNTIFKNHEANSGEELVKIEKQNLKYYGYGIKGFILSLIETSIKLSNNASDNETINTFLNLGKKMLVEPVKILPNVKSTLKILSKDYKLILITKGDLLDQERKVNCSNISQFFNHIEIVSDKTTKTYTKIFDKHKINPEKFVMVGNSLKSDILPVTEIGGFGIYIPFKLTWELEKVDYAAESTDFVQLDDISLIMPWLQINCEKL